MNKIERVRAALHCAAVDRPPYGFWTHLPGIDLDPDRLAAATADFAERHDLDFVKSMSNGLYCVEDWGCVCDYSEIERGGVARVTTAAVNAPGDWDRLGEVDVLRGSFGRELHHFGRLSSLVGAAVPVLATVFSPLTIAGKLSNGLYRRHIEEAPDALLRGLETITAVTCRFAAAALSRGCAGVFFAVQEAGGEGVDEAAYRRFGEPFDRRVLAAAAEAGGWFNVVHMHGDRILFDLLKDYPVDALNWHIGETPPLILDYRSTGGIKPIVGGLQRGHITRRELDAIHSDIESAMVATGGRGLLLAPGCVIRHPVDDPTLQAAADMIRGCRAI